MRALMLLILLLPGTALSQTIGEKEAQARLEQLFEQGSDAARGTLAPELVPEKANEPSPPRNLSTTEVLSSLAREVQQLRSRVSVQQASASSTQKPEAARNIGSKTYYSYREGAIFKIHAGVDRVTDIELQPGEKLTNQPVAGDTVRWTVGTMTSSSKKGPQVHLIVKPLEEELETNIVVTTNRRVYHLQVQSGDWYMPAVAWNYPEDEDTARLAELERTKEDEVLSLSPDKLEFDYEIVHDDESWAPVRCFDDGQKTYIQMPKELASGEAPALFLLEDDKEPILVNYRVKGSYYILDRLFTRAELRIGKAEPVLICSPRSPRTLWERIF